MRAIGLRAIGNVVDKKFCKLKSLRSRYIKEYLRIALNICQAIVGRGFKLCPAINTS